MGWLSRCHGNRPAPGGSPKDTDVGVELPLELIVQGTSDGSYQHRVFSRLTPALLAFTPREGEAHSVALRETGHNRWWGSLRFQVAGELLQVAT